MGDTLAIGTADLLTIADALVYRAHLLVTDAEAIDRICRALHAIGYDETARSVRCYADTTMRALAGHSVKV